MENITTMEDIIAILKIDGRLIQKFEEHTEEMCITAVRNSPWSLRFCNIRSIKVCLTALKQDPCVSSVILDKSFKIHEIIDSLNQKMYENAELEKAKLKNSELEKVVFEQGLEILSLKKDSLQQDEIIDSLDKKLHEKRELDVVSEKDEEISCLTKDCRELELDMKLLKVKFDRKNVESEVLKNDVEKKEEYIKLLERKVDRVNLGEWFK